MWHIAPAAGHTVTFAVNATQRSILFQLDSSIQRLAKDVPGHASLVDLAGVYHNLLRAWADS